MPSIRRYVIVESTGVGLTVLERSEPGEAWRATILADGDILRMPEINIDIPVAAAPPPGRAAFRRRRPPAPA